MGGNKPRLYIALSPSGVTNNEERKYHWSFLVGPKSESKSTTPGIRYHVRNRPIEGWKYEEVPLENVQCSNSLLARIVIAKIEDEQRLIDIFRTTECVQNDPNWRCRTWIAGALARIQQDGTIVGTSVLNWPTIEAAARGYVANKTAAGRYLKASDMALPKPTFNLYENVEVIS